MPFHAGGVDFRFHFGLGEWRERQFGKPIHRFE
jgi:hypothetical protein